MTASDVLTRARTLLFVPGDRPDRFPKAAASGAGLVVLDLEDAVGSEDKTLARHFVDEWLAKGNTCAVRVNAFGTPWHEDDLEAVAAHDCVAVIPKAETPDVLAGIALRVGDPLVALVETASGVFAAQEIAKVEGVERLALGTFDLAAELGVSPDDQMAMAWSRGALVLASAAAEIAAPVDGVTSDVKDEQRLNADVELALRLGFGAKLCIHPRQVPLVERRFRPTEEALRWARAVVEAAASGAVVVLDGKMVDKPVVDRARRILQSE